MSDLRSTLQSRLSGRACVVGVGNVELGDDGFGPCVAEALSEAGIQDVIVAGTTPERWTEKLTSSGYDSVLFLDAVEFPGEPGAAVLLEANEIRARFPQVSTHKISLGTLAKVIEHESAAKVLLLGVKPESLAGGAGLTPPVRDSASGLAAILSDVLSSNPKKLRCEAQ
jgi:hydrogenase maturation protease